jgi:pimeloyl-ACP methyl ester carboxylesterase
MGEVREETIEVEGWADDPWPVTVRRSGDAPTLWMHGVPTSGEDWVPFLERCGGIAPDLPGFGSSSKRGDGDFTIRGYARFTGALLDTLGIEQVELVVHDWGAAALAWAVEHPERISKLVVINSVPLLSGYRWHRVARIWRTRGLGEMLMGSTSGWGLRRTLPTGIGSTAARGFDQGTQRAILGLYRSAPSELLASYESRLRVLAGVPALVVWGQEDPYITPKFAHRYAEALGGADVVVLPGAGHWPWIDGPEVLHAIDRFLR